MKFLLLSFLLFYSLLLSAELTIEERVSLIKKEKAEAQKESDRLEQIERYRVELQALEQIIFKEKVWMKSYASYVTSIEVRDNLAKIKKRINHLSKKAKTTSDHDELNALLSKENILTSQIEKLKGKYDAPFSKLITPPKIDDIPEISNPFDIFTGISLVKTLNSNFDEYIKRKKSLNSLVVLLRKENSIYKQMSLLDIEKRYEKEALQKEQQLERFETALDTINVTSEVYQKRLEIAELNINKAVEKQIYRVAKIGIIILVVFIVFFLLKLVVKKYITDNERFYMANKVITFANFTFILLILFFNYIENAAYLVTILGFASAGIAIAMKDWFMSMLGWLVIIFGGSIHVGDRIRVVMDGHEYVGDVMDISLLRMTIFEDVTLTTHMTNRRAG
ncbi:MAG: mechanosensitive ion channel domain-containing protein, partial [Campylobacterota bacterium]